MNECETECWMKRRRQRGCEESIEVYLPNSITPVWIADNVPLPKTWTQMDRPEWVQYIMTNDQQLLRAEKEEEGPLHISIQPLNPSSPCVAVEDLAEWIYQLQRTVTRYFHVPLRMVLKSGKMHIPFGDWANDDEWTWLATYRSGRDQPPPAEECVLSSGVRRLRHLVHRFPTTRPTYDVASFNDPTLMIYSSFGIWTEVAEEHIFPSHVCIPPESECLSALQQGRLHHPRFPEWYVTFPPPVVLFLKSM